MTERDPVTGRFVEPQLNKRQNDEYHVTLRALDDAIRKASLDLHEELSDDD